MITYNGLPNGAKITAKQRAAQIVDNILAQTQNVYTDQFNDPELDVLTRREYAEIVRQVESIGKRMHKLIEKTLAEADLKGRSSDSELDSPIEIPRIVLNRKY